MRFQRQRNFASGLLNVTTPAGKIGVTIGAIALIGVCGFLVYRGLFRDKPPETLPLALTVMECEKCHNTQEFSPAEIKEMGKEKYMTMTQAGIDCPKCGAVKGMKMTVMCPIPSCHFHYLIKFGEKNLCPKCGADYTEAKIANP